MSGRLLILRPRPGAVRTAARAQEMGFEVVVAPLFTVLPLGGEPPDRSEVDCVLVTSANAPPAAAGRLTAFLDLPCLAVGETSAEAARAAGFTDVRVGPSDGAALTEMAKRAGFRRALHPCGRNVSPLATTGFERLAFPVYASEPVTALPAAAAEAIAAGAVVLLHSPRAAATFASLFDGRRDSVRLAAISASAAAAAGTGWGEVAVAVEPRDPALLAVAAELCHKPGR
jgi:uroporphyrinogen-III synthase